jgi:hypothetical protein
MTTRPLTGKEGRGGRKLGRIEVQVLGNPMERKRERENKKSGVGCLIWEELYTLSNRTEKEGKGKEGRRKDVLG